MKRIMKWLADFVVRHASLKTPPSLVVSLKASEVMELKMGASYRKVIQGPATISVVQG